MGNACFSACPKRKKPSGDLEEANGGASTSKDGSVRLTRGLTNSGYKKNGYVHYCFHRFGPKDASDRVAGGGQGVVRKDAAVCEVLTVDGGGSTAGYDAYKR